MTEVLNRVSGLKVCIALNYYFPYVSGLSNVAKDVAEGLALRGWDVTVIASQHEKSLPLAELINGVKIIRTPVTFRLGKGVISPLFIPTVLKYANKSNVLNLHAPMLEAGVIASLSLPPVLMTYQCDISLPPTLIGRLQNWLMDLSMRIAANKSTLVSVSSLDYASHSRISPFLSEKDVEIPPICHFRCRGVPKYRTGDGTHIGFLGRIVEEKGIEHLVDGFREYGDPEARLLIAGDFKNISGGSVIERVRDRIRDDGRISILGFLSDSELNDFYASLDIFALPSVNSFEAFGIVQVEAMFLGIPVLASNLPGVRQPVIRTGMGKIIEPRSSVAIADALHELRAEKVNLMAGKELAVKYYSAEFALNQFENALLRSIEMKNGGGNAG